MFAIRSNRVFLPGGTRPATIHVRDGRIAAIDDARGADVDYGDLAILPGIVDSHVHVNEPGRTEWEGFATATRAAAAGGVTTIVDMPLNSIPPTTSLAALREKADAMRGKLHVDVALWGGVVPGNTAELRPMLDAGARGFKCFLVNSGVEEFPHVDAQQLEEAMRELAPTGAPLLVHAELGEHLHDAQGDATSYARYVASRPRAAEDAAIALVYETAKRTGAHAHIVHLSSSGGLATLEHARREGVNLTAETTPHYLFFDAESIPDGAPQYKCAPPIREHDNREQLWDAVTRGLLVAIVSDHSPCTPELKHLGAGDVARAWGGIASLQFSLPVVWTEARRRGIALETIVPLMTSGPAKLARLDARKGTLAAGYDADFTIFDPDARFVVRPELTRHRHKTTPYEGLELHGVVAAAYVGGERAGDALNGRWLTSANS